MATQNYNLPTIPGDNVSGDVPRDLNALANAVDTVLATHSMNTGHVYYAVDTGSANAKVVTLSPTPTAYVDGIAVAFKNTAANTGAATINVNGLGAKPIVKSNGTALTSGSLKAGSIYTIRYNSTTGNFIVQGEGGEYGTAGAAQVLSGFTIGTDSGIVNGTMPDRRGNNYEQVGITVGNGDGNLYLNTPDGYYNTTSSIRVQDGDFIAQNIPADKNIFGLQGAIPRGSAYTNAVSYVVANGTLYVRFPIGVYQSGGGEGKPEVLVQVSNLTPANVVSGVNILGVTGEAIPVKSASEYGTSTGTYTVNTDNWKAIRVTISGSTTYSGQPALINGSSTAYDGSSVTVPYTIKSEANGSTLYGGTLSCSVTTGSCTVTIGGSMQLVNSIYINAYGF